MDDVQCLGTENTLSSCTHISTHNCGHSEDAGVTCLSNLNMHNNNILLLLLLLSYFNSSCWW